MSDAATCSLRSDGTLLVNGQPSFPVGFYHLSDVKPSGTGDTTRTVDLTTIAGAGFDLFQPVIDAPDINTTQLLTDCNTKGVKLIAQYYWDGGQSYRQSLVTGLKDNAAILGWNVADDVNFPPSSPNYTPSALSVKAQEIKGYAPNNLTFGAFVTDPGSLNGAVYPPSTYAGIVDVAGIESYPIDEQNCAPSEELQYHAQSYINARTAFRGTKTTYWAIPQTFAWNSRWPTIAESRNMLWVSLIYGSRGIMCYTYYDQKGLFPSVNPSLWAYYRDTLVHEVASMRPALLNGVLTTPSGLPSYCHAGVWTLPDKVYVVIANTNTTTAKTATIPLPSDAVGPATSIFAGDPGSFSVSSGNLTGVIQPRGVAVYGMSRTGGTPSPTPTPAPTPTPTPAPVSGPDLVISSVTMSPASPAPGDEVTFTATVKNQGNAATPTGQAGGTFLGVGFQIDGQWATWDDLDYASLAAGATVTLKATNGQGDKATWTALSGTHTLTAVVDNQNMISESGETNNLMSLGFNVGGSVGIAPDIADTYVWDGAPSSNYGSSSIINVKRSTTGYNRQGLLKFDISRFPTVGTATLVFNARLNTASSNVFTNIYGEPNVTWNEKTTTWYSRISPGALLGQVSVSPTMNTFRFDVTNYVKGQRAAGAASVSFMLINPLSSSAVSTVSSRESATPPVLNITP